MLVTRILELDPLVSVLEQEVELPEDLGHVPPVDLIHDQEVRLRGMLPSAPRALAQSPGNEAELDLSVAGRDRPVALEEVLVRAGGMELDQPHVPAVLGEMAAESRRDERLSGSGWPVEDELPLLLEKIEDVLLKPLLREMQIGGKLRRGRRHH